MVAKRTSSALLGIGHWCNRLFCSIWLPFVPESRFVEGVNVGQLQRYGRVAHGWMETGLW